MATKLAQITDGTSNTVGVCELVRGQGAYAGGLDGLKPSSSFATVGAAASGAPGGTASPQADNTACIGTGGITSSNAMGANTGDLPNGAMWAWGRSGQTRYNHVMPPNTYNCSFGTGSSGDSDDDALTASSRHSGGVNAMMMDGSVRFIKATVSLPTWWALATMAGGEVVSADQY